MKLVNRLFCLLFAFVSVNAGGPTLILLDNLAIRETHSIFFKTLQGILKNYYFAASITDMLPVLLSVFLNRNFVEKTDNTYII